MRNKILFIISGLGLVLAVVSAFIFAEQPKAQPPLFNPAANPYASGIYSEGMIESDQAQGENINIYPEVAGPITQILASEGQQVHRGDPLLSIDDSVQRATAEQQRSQADAALAMLNELKAEPRPESLAVAVAQVENARANLKNTQDELAKQQHSYELDPRSVSMDALDNARNAEKVAASNLAVVERQYELTKAGRGSTMFKIRSDSTLPCPRRTRHPRRCWPNTRSGRRRMAPCSRCRPESAATCPRKAPMTRIRRATIRSS